MIVHCRRRKIRCLLAPDDAQNRCSNCIRLKKECNFFPVDQQPPVERRPRAESKVDGRSADASTSASSSPSVTAGHSAEQDQFSPYPIMPLSAHPFSGSMGPLGATTMSPPGSAGKLMIEGRSHISADRKRVGPMPSPFEFPDHHRGSWDQHPYYETPGGSTVPDDQPQSGFWMRPEPPMTPSYSTYPSGHHNSIVHPIRESDGSYSPFPKADGWQAPRSMSYSHPEGSANYGPDNFNQIYQPELRHNSAEMPPPSLRNSASSSIASMSETPSIPQSGQMYHFVSGLGGVPTQSPKSLEFGGGGWYPDPSQLPKVREEEVQHHHLIEGPAMLYSAAGHH